MSTWHPLAAIEFSADTDDNGLEYRLIVPERVLTTLASLTDFELKVMAAEVSIIVRNALEMPPSPKPEGEN